MAEIIYFHHAAEYGIDPRTVAGMSKPVLTRVITDAMKPFRAWTNANRRFKRRIGYESKAGRLIRDGLPRPGGCLVVVVVAATICAVALAR